MKVIFLSLFLTFPYIVIGQSGLPDYGKIADIQGKSKVYLIADGESRTTMIKTLTKQKALTVVDKAEEAEFFIEYRTISRQPFGFGGTSETGQLDAYFYSENRRVVCWTKSDVGGGFKGDTARRLLNAFLKAFVKK